jgi:hypothetical protein
MPTSSDTANLLMYGAQHPVTLARRVLPQNVWMSERDVLDRLADPETLRRHSQTHELAQGFDRSGMPVTVRHPVVRQVNAGDSLAYARLDNLLYFQALERRGLGLGRREFRFKTDAELEADEQRTVARNADTRTMVTLFDADGRPKLVPQSERDDHARIINEELRRRRAANAKAQLDGEPLPFPGNVPV